MSGSAQEAAATRTATLTAARQRSAERDQQRLKERWEHRPMAAERMMQELAQAAPPDTIVADEAITSAPALMRAFSSDQPGILYVMRVPWFF